MDFSAIYAATAAIGTLVTALATIALWRVTAVLAVQTAKMADAAAQPQIVVTLETSRWALMHCDLCVTNTGNAAAFDIQIQITPSLIIRNDHAQPLPFSRIGVLRPGQSLSSYVGMTDTFLESPIAVITSWRKHPSVSRRESLEYQIDLSGLRGSGDLGGDPIISLAREVKNLRDDWRGIARGQVRMGVDFYSEDDRCREEEAQKQRWAEEDKQDDIDI